MKRRLDLALALVHEPSILFLDEPTTGLDPQSRNALWAEVARLARDDGVTVFLTTQYLEEADVLADRVGIIDHGRIVAEGTPASLKAEIGRPSVEAIPADPAELAAVGRTLERFGAPVPGSPKAASVRLDGGEEALADVVRALDAEEFHLQHPSRTHRRSTTSSSPRPAARSRGQGTRRRRARSRRRRRPRPRDEPQPPSSPGRPPRAPLGRADASPAAERRPVVRLPADPARGQRRRAPVGCADSRFPADSYLDFALAFTFLQGALFATTNAGTDLARHPDGLSRPARADADATCCLAAGPARRRRGARAAAGDALPDDRPDRACGRRAGSSASS